MMQFSAILLDLKDKLFQHFRINVFPFQLSAYEMFGGYF